MQYVTYINLPDYLKEWAVNRWGNPIRFPSGSVENSVIRNLLQKLPKGVEPVLPSDGAVAVVLPNSKHKPLETFNYISVEGRDAIAAMVHDLLSVQLWNDMRRYLFSADEVQDPRRNPMGKIAGELKANVGVMNIIRNWCRVNGISIDHDNTIKQKWYRQRKKTFPDLVFKGGK